MGLDSRKRPNWSGRAIIHGHHKRLAWSAVPRFCRLLATIAVQLWDSLNRWQAVRFADRPDTVKFSSSNQTGYHLTRTTAGNIVLTCTSLNQVYPVDTGCYGGCFSGFFGIEKRHLTGSLIVGLFSALHLWIYRTLISQSRIFTQDSKNNFSTLHKHLPKLPPPPP